MIEYRGILHVRVLVANTARALVFYRDVLGLEVRTDRPDLCFPGAWLTVGAQQLHLLELPNIPIPWRVVRRTAAATGTWPSPWLASRRSGRRLIALLCPIRSAAWAVRRFSRRVVCLLLAFAA